MADEFWKDPKRTAPVAQLIESETQRMVREEHERALDRWRKLIAEVVRENPDATPTRLMQMAMKRTRGSANPTWVSGVIRELLDEGSRT